MAWNQADIDALQDAIADGKGVKTITFGEQTVTFQTLAEMLQLLAVMEADVNAATHQSHRLAAVSKGV